MNKKELQVYVISMEQREGKLYLIVKGTLSFIPLHISMAPGSTNHGMMGAWREAWRWRERELFIVIEDDVEMSVWWYRALANLWTRYGDRWH